MRSYHLEICPPPCVCTALVYVCVRVHTEPGTCTASTRTAGIWACILSLLESKSCGFPYVLEQEIWGEQGETKHPWVKHAGKLSSPCFIHSYSFPRNLREYLPLKEAQ